MITEWHDRETEEWWWGGKSHPTQRFREHNEDDEKLDYSDVYETFGKHKRKAIILAAVLLLTACTTPNGLRTNQSARNQVEQAEAYKQSVAR